MTAAALLALLNAPTVPAQSLGPSTGGIVALDQSLRFLGHTRRVLMIAAHPDDEDTELLAVLARGMGAETAYLSLTRGEGGQNLIGDELGPALGILRTEELLAARELDGARQFFTRAYDFGYSKGLPDTWKFWPADTVLKDVVRTIRRFQPQVIVAVFSGTPRDGHGQHQASGWAAREAFKAAADSTRFPELAAEGLRPWRTLKLYQSARFDSDTGVATLDGGVIDRAVGQSFLQIAMRGRSLHRSQDMGVPQRMGPSTVRIRLVEDLTGSGAQLFAGIDTSLGAALGPGARPEDRAEAGRIAAQISRVTPLSVDGLADARTAFARLIGSVGLSAAAREQLGRLDAAAAIASGVVCDATAGVDRVVSGGRLLVMATCWNTGTRPQQVSTRVTVVGREAFTAPSRAIAPDGVVIDSAWITIPAETAPSQPYYLRSPLRGAQYQWPTEDSASWGAPADPAPLRAQFLLADGIVIRRDVVYRTIDQGLGEVRRPLFVVPRVDVHQTPASGLWPVSGTSPHEIVVTLRHNVADTTTGSVSLVVPAGWPAPVAKPFVLRGVNADMVFRFQVRPPSGAALETSALRAVARDAASREYTAGTDRVTYPHIRPRQLVTTANTRAVIADIKLPPDRAIAYVRGAADRIPESLMALGLQVTLIGADSLVGTGALSRFRIVVIGPRAWETEPALSEHNDRLVEWVRDGGTLIVQYQQFQYLRGGFAPFDLSLAEKPGDPVPARVAAPRVADEDARVTMLDPTHPIMRFPNVITSRDWDGWVQERGLYFPRSWGSEWTPLLEMSDTGEPPLRGALLVTRCGRGTYVYTGLSFFRELPAAVPGAARLFLNLLALRRQGG